MYVGYNWLKEYVEIPYSPEELADRLTMLGLEAGGIEKFPKGLDDCRIVQIKKISPHPNADRLSVCQVDSGNEELNIVCGAPNVKTGDKVPLALPGVKLPSGYKISETVIRGVHSKGMLCSAEELNLGNDPSGLLILPDDAPIGMPLVDFLGLSDTVIEVELTPNRSDCLSHLGIAREIAAIIGKKASVPEIDFIESGESIHDLVEVQILDPDLCFRYAARVIKGIEVAPSPPWLVARLGSIGIRSVNNVVDVTNYILMETGQPLHAFDLDFIQNKKLVIRKAKNGENLKTLDTVQRQIDDTMLIIADANHPLALAGIMGGVESHVSENTKNILIESAFFNPANIRKTSRKIGLNTEASQRFERGIDPEGVLLSAERATQLILQLAGGESAKGSIDIYPRSKKRAPVLLRTKRVNTLLGLDLSSEKICTILENLSFTPLSQTDEKMEFIPPSFRYDISQEVDLIEEVARYYGYDQIHATIPSGKIPAGAKISKKYRLCDIVRDILKGVGFLEVINFSFTKKSLFDIINLEQSNKPYELMEIENPLTQDQNALRASIIPSLIQNCIYNLSRHNYDLKIFEVGRCFTRSKTREAFTDEFEKLGILLTGIKNRRDWRLKEQETDLYDLKGAIEYIFQCIGLKGYSFKTIESPWLDESTSMQILHKDREIGILGRLSSKVEALFDLRQSAFIGELDLDLLVQIAEPWDHKFQPIPKFPPVLRDIAIVLERDIPYKKVMDIIIKEGGALLKEVYLFDLYMGEQIPEGKKGLAFSLTYQSEDKTLTDEEVNEVHKSIYEQLNVQLNAELR